MLLLEAQTEHERLKEGCAINQPFGGKLPMQLDSVHKGTAPAVAACAKESVAAGFGHQATWQLKLTPREQSKRYRTHLLNLLCTHINIICISSRHLYATCLLGSAMEIKDAH